MMKKKSNKRPKKNPPKIIEQDLENELEDIEINPEPLEDEKEEKRHEEQGDQAKEEKMENKEILGDSQVEDIDMLTETPKSIRKKAKKPASTLQNLKEEDIGLEEKKPKNQIEDEFFDDWGQESDQDDDYQAYLKRKKRRRDKKVARKKYRKKSSRRQNETPSTTFGGVSVSQAIPGQTFMKTLDLSRSEKPKKRKAPKKQNLDQWSGLS